MSNATTTPHRDNGTLTGELADAYDRIMDYRIELGERAKAKSDRRDYTGAHILAIKVLALEDAMRILRGVPVNS